MTTIKGRASTNNGSCVMATRQADGTVDFWDSKVGESHTWRFSYEQWRSFIDSVKEGRLRHPPGVAMIAAGIYVTVTKSPIGICLSRSDMPASHTFTDDEWLCFHHGAYFTQFDNWWTTENPVTLWAKPDGSTHVLA